MQHYWLVFACDKLGLTRFLLPLLTKKAVVSPPTFILIKCVLCVCSTIDTNKLTFLGSLSLNIALSLLLLPSILTIPLPVPLSL